MAAMPVSIYTGTVAISNCSDGTDDATTRTMDTIVIVAHAGLSLARAEVADPDGFEQSDEPGSTVEDALLWFDDVVARARAHFEAEQNGEDA